MIVKKVALAPFLVFICVSIVFMTSTYAQHEEILLTVYEDVEVSFSYVLEAEMGGAEVSDLVFKLNKAISLIDGAILRVESRNFDEAIDILLDSRTISREVLVQARDLSKNLGDTNDVNPSKYLIDRVVIVVGTIFLFFGWMIFKQYYFKRLIGMRPVIEDVES